MSQINSVQIEIKRGEAGLWYLTSPQIKGLLIAQRSVVECIEELPQTYHDLMLFKKSEIN